MPVLREFLTITGCLQVIEIILSTHWIKKKSQTELRWTSKINASCNQYNGRRANYLEMFLINGFIFNNSSIFVKIFFEIPRLLILCKDSAGSCYHFKNRAMDFRCFGTHPLSVINNFFELYAVSS